MLGRIGCPDYRVVNAVKLTLNDAEVERKAGMIGFYSMTVRAFKLDLEDRCEDYGQVAYYNGSIDAAPHAFVLDDHHTFRTGMPVPVCSNTAAMVGLTRYGRHFRVVGDASVHHGLFDCGPSPVIAKGQDGGFGACC